MEDEDKSKRRNSVAIRAKSVSNFVIPGSDCTARRKQLGLNPHRILDVLEVGKLFQVSQRESDSQKRYEKAIQYRPDEVSNARPSFSNTRSRASSVSSITGISKPDATTPNNDIITDPTIIVITADEQEERNKLKSKLNWLLETEETGTITLSTLTPQEHDRAYESALHCLLFPLLQYQDSTVLEETEKLAPRLTTLKESTEYRSLIPFHLEDYQLLKKLYRMKDENAHTEIMNRVLSADYFVYTLLSENIKHTNTSELYKKEAFSIEDNHTQWVNYHQNSYKPMLNRLKMDANFQGIISIDIIEARGLVAKERDSFTSNPFCEVSLVAGDLMKGSANSQDEKKAKTCVISKTLNPVWMQEFAFPLTETFRAYRLKFTIWDHSPAGKSYMGEVEVDLGTMRNHSTRDEWLHLTKMGKWTSFGNITVSGDIHVRIHLNFRTLVTDLQPESSPNYPFVPTEAEAHKYYDHLLDLVLRMENPDLHEIHPPSPFCQSLLEEYSYRYCIPYYHRALAHLEWLLNHWTLNRLTIWTVYEAMHHIEQIKFRTKLDMTKEERKRYRECMTKTRDLTEEAMGSYIQLFEGKKMDGTLKALSQVLVFVLLMSREAPATIMDNLIKNSASSLYMNYVAEAEPLNARKMTDVMQKILQHMEDDAQVYQSQFGKETILLAITSSVYKGFLLQDITKVVMDVPSILSADLSTSDLFDMHFCVVELNKIWKNHLKMSPIPLEDMFEPYILMWIDSLRDRLRFWMKQSINEDEASGWEALSMEQIPPILHSSSVVDLFQCLDTCVTFLASFEDEIGREKNIRNLLNMVTVNVIEFFVQQLKLSCLNDVTTKKIRMSSGLLTPERSPSRGAASPRLVPSRTGSFGASPNRPTANTSFCPSQLRPSNSGSFGAASPKMPLRPSENGSFGKGVTSPLSPKGIRSPTSPSGVTSPMSSRFSSSPMQVQRNTSSPKMASSPKLTRLASKLFGRSPSFSSPTEIPANGDAVTSPTREVPQMSSSSTGNAAFKSPPSGLSVSLSTTKVTQLHQLSMRLTPRMSGSTPDVQRIPEALLASSPKTSISHLSPRLSSSQTNVMKSEGKTPPALMSSPMAWKKRNQLKWIVPRDLCIKLNDMEMVGALQDDFSTHIRKTLNYPNEDETVLNLLKPSINASRSTYSDLLDLLVTYMNHDMKIEVEKIFDPRTNGNAEPLFTYLSAQLDVLHNWMYPGVFQNTLQKIFLILTKNLELQLFPFNVDDETNSQPKVPLVQRMIEELFRFFTADGTDLPKSYAEKHTRHLKDCISLFTMSTAELFEVVERKRKSNRPILVKRDVKENVREDGGETTITTEVTSPSTGRKTKVTMPKSVEKARESEEQKFDMIPSSFALPALAILINRSKDGDSEAKSVLKKKKETLGSQLMCNLMGIYNEEEHLITKFLCSIQYTFGSLVVLSSYIALHKFIGNSHPTVIAIRDITSIAKRENKGLSIVCNDGQEYMISNLYEVSRKHVIDAIKSRAKAVGNKSILGKVETRNTSLEVEEQVLTGATDPKAVEKWNRVVREKFGQPRETVLGVYTCYYRHNVPEFGHLIVTEGLVCFSSSRPLLPHHLCIPLSQIADISTQNAAWILPTALSITNSEDKKHVFSSFSNRDEVYNLIHSLWFRRIKYTEEK
ncbi:putative membrane protein [Planoprotostelium fungivorum]|uniref:Putative membrane protein n=1 Tax=Planoprotostelium fungivorum TaxID=1890364 RepID=A0A2P6NH25_9EUKA|nr:putative membrane protein [Planoprotostelium fungivorum]